MKSEHLLWDLINLSSREKFCYRYKPFYLKVSFFDPVKETSALLSITFKSWIDKAKLSILLGHAHKYFKLYTVLKLLLCEYLVNSQESIEFLKTF